MTSQQETRNRRLGLPPGIRACLFGLDGVVTRTTTEGVAVFEDAVRYLTALRDAGVPRAVVTSSANAVQVLDVTGLAPLFDARVDAVVAAERRLAGKPEPDTYLAGAALLGVIAPQAAVFEDALAGVRAADAGGFGHVVGVDRVGQAAQLAAHGADRVVTHLTDLLDLTSPTPAPTLEKR